MEQCIVGLLCLLLCFSSGQEVPPLPVHVGAAQRPAHQHAGEHGARRRRPAVWSRARSQSDARAAAESGHAPFL